MLANRVRMAKQGRKTEIIEGSKFKFNSNMNVADLPSGQYDFDFYFEKEGSILLSTYIRKVDIFGSPGFMYSQGNTSYAGVVERVYDSGGQGWRGGVQDYIIVPQEMWAPVPTNYKKWFANNTTTLGTVQIIVTGGVVR